ncbi:dihydropyrimidine dehydrogenase [Endozoicomonas sp. OPT23]|uniref:NAD(P)-dependent oxidoreductase n=1 Tax=Endozoicomonas sp. OPT23 TaxID=2072845 RepID=UPI00129A9F24|nr:NAD(P)-dependent oxidoreductase [Endozoicomonas sp. OPT23]MRI31405.1 dihydropyrimidine dehydrogenase [Endozoicomonas sp. OPT23]
MNEPDIKCERLAPSEYQKRFSDIKPAFNQNQALVESSRCLYCEAAPCVQACPTHINVPSFIHRINTNNIDGAAKTILEANIFGGSCARVCPTEILCEKACVRNFEPECQPIQIGRLQRYAIDNFSQEQYPFQRATPSGKKVAVVGAGPAGISCAHGLACMGHDVIIIDAGTKPGGLNEYGIAAYKLVDDYAQEEIEKITEIGGIEWKLNTHLGLDIQLDTLREQYDAVFLAIGLSDKRTLSLSGEESAGVKHAVDDIAELRRTENLSQISVGKRVVVIGGGNTAIDIACQIKRLGAETVVMVYRRSVECMSATWKEQKFALLNGVEIRTNCQPVAIQHDSGKVTGLLLDQTVGNSDSAERISIDADIIYRAIGQTMCCEHLALDKEIPEIQNGRITVDEQRRTTVKGVWAGGDCVDFGENLTVQAVQHGKEAAASIDRYLKTGG